MPTKYEYVKQWRASMPHEVLRQKRNEEARKYREKYAEKVREYQRQWRRENIELHRAQDAANHRKHRRINAEAQRLRMRRFKDKLEQALLAQAGRPRPDSCDLCGETAKTVFDHDHATGLFRGWLCQRCNRTLGQIKDSIPLLMRMADYISRGGIGNGETDLSGAETSSEIDVCNTRKESISVE